MMELFYTNAGNVCRARDLQMQEAACAVEAASTTSGFTCAAGVVKTQRRSGAGQEQDWANSKKEWAEQKCFHHLNLNPRKTLV